MVEECRRICESCYNANWDSDMLEPYSIDFDGCDENRKPYYDPFDKQWKCKDYKELQPLHLE